MIVIDKTKYAKRILKEGLEKNDYYSKKKLYSVAYYLVNYTQYRTKQIFDNMKRISSKYYDGMSDEFIENEINSILTDIKSKNKPDKKYEVPKINIYQNELDKISKLKLNEVKENKKQDEKIQMLAFAYLVYAKVEIEKSKDRNSERKKMWFPARNKELFQFAKIDKNTSGMIKNQMLQSLVENEIIQFTTFFKYGASLMFTVPILNNNEESEIVYSISNYDDISVYYKHYNKSPNIKLCEDCETPIEITSNSIKYCYDCALKNNR